MRMNVCRLVAILINLSIVEKPNQFGRMMHNERMHVETIFTQPVLRYTPPGLFSVESEESLET